MLHNLKYLEASGCIRIKDDGLCELIKNNLSLEILNLEGCEFITDKLLVVAMDAVKDRINDSVLKISTLNSGLKGRDFINISTSLKVVKSFKRIRGIRKVGFQDIFFSEGEDTYQVIEY